VIAFAAVGHGNFSDVMRRERWHDIKACLALTDKGVAAPVVDGVVDRCFKVRLALSELDGACQRWVKVGRIVTIDEMMVKCKGL
jgi:hypothetical protein